MSQEETKTKKPSKPWDKNMRILARLNPQAFVDLLLPGACFIREVAEKLDSWVVECDLLVEVEEGGERLLVNIEFQSTYDEAMPRRLLEYTMFASKQYEMPVVALVIHLLGDKEIDASPWRWRTKAQRPILDYYYERVEIARYSPEVILQRHQPGLLPFLPLTNGGATRQMVRQMVQEMKPYQDKELEAIGLRLAALIFTHNQQWSDCQWLKKEFPMLDDILRHTFLYTEAIEEGKKVGIEEGIKEGQFTALKQMIIDVVRLRFPQLEDLAQERVVLSNSLGLLKQVNLHLITARDEQEAESHLLTLTADA